MFSHRDDDCTFVRERLEREYDLDLVATAPSVAYLANLVSGEQAPIRSPQDLPDVGSLVSIEEPYVKVMIITPSEYVGTVMELVQQRRGDIGEMTYLTPERVAIVTLITPVTALLLGAYLNGEIISGKVIVGTALILAGLTIYEYGKYLPHVKRWKIRWLQRPL